jgi:hypothetical protein
MQYNKQFAYIGCKLQNIAVTNKCDCETAYKQNFDNTNKIPFEKVNFQIIDEYFTITETTFETQYLKLQNKPAAYKLPFKTRLFAFCNYRPPALLHSVSTIA